MSLVTCPCRKSLDCAPLRASLPRSERSTTNVVTDERLALVEAGEPAPDLALELVHHPVAGDARGERRPHDLGLLGAVEPLEQREQPRQVEGERVGGHVYALSRPIMPLVEDFQAILDALPSDWTDLELDLRVDEDRYVDAATLLVTANVQPYSHHDWHLHIIIAHNFGHAAAAPVVHGTLRLLDEAGIAGELALREVRAGRVETINLLGRAEALPRAFRRIRG